jgi:hypothetical protein
MKRILSTLLVAFIVVVAIAILMPDPGSEPSNRSLTGMITSAALGTACLFVIFMLFGWLIDGIKAGVRRVRGKNSGA